MIVCREDPMAMRHKEVTYEVLPNLLSSEPRMVFCVITHFSLLDLILVNS